MRLREAYVIQSNDNFLEETRRRIVKAYLPTIIMMRINEATITSVNDIISLIRKSYSIQFSPGTIYPIFYKLEKNGRIKKIPNQAKKIYVLTGIGKSMIENFLARTDYFYGIPSKLNEIIK
jgi:DNA-binding PadR family transcriptional regulator